MKVLKVIGTIGRFALAGVLTARDFLRRKTCAETLLIFHFHLDESGALV